jgi:RHS repeat-associated protein
VDRDVVNNLTWSTGTYLYDGSGNIKTIGSDSYWYDTAGRLIKAEVGGTVETYQYDSFGNLVEKTSGGATAHFGPDPRTNRLAGESYDAAGAQLTRTGLGTYYSYDSVGSLMWISEEGYSGMGGEDFYLYTADDERIVTFQTEDEAYIRVRDLKNRVVREYFDYEADGWMEWQRDYIYAGDRLVSGQGISGEMRHYHRDHLGSTRLITDRDGVQIAKMDYFPFGVEKTSTVQESGLQPDPMKFTGHERDYNGLYWIQTQDYLDYMHARYYQARMGRFLTVDPGRDWDMVKPQSWNRYGYARNSPVSIADPDGRNAVLVLRLARFLGPPALRYALRQGVRAAGPTFVRASTDYLRQRTSSCAHPVVLPQAMSVPAVSWPGWDPNAPPEGFTDWRGKKGAAPGSNALGAWVNPETNEYLSPDLEHAEDKGRGPHWTYGDANGKQWDVYPDDVVVPAGEKKTEGEPQEETKEWEKTPPET